MGTDTSVASFTSASYHLTPFCAKLIFFINCVSFIVICNCCRLFEGCTKERNVSDITASLVWKYDTEKCVDASPLLVCDGSEIIYLFIELVTDLLAN